MNPMNPMNPMESINQKFFKHIHHYLSLREIARLKQLNKSWSKLITNCLSQHHSTELKWIESANKLTTNNQLIKFKETIFQDYAFLPHLGLMLKVFYQDEFTLRINFVSLNVHRYLLIPLTQKSGNLQLYYFMHLFWDQSKKILKIQLKSFFVEVDLFHLSNIGVQLIKKAKNSKKFTNGMSNERLGNYFAYDQLGNKILSIITKKNQDTGVYLQIKYQKAKSFVKLKLHDFYPSQIFSFGNQHIFSLVRYRQMIVIIDNTNPTDFQKVNTSTNDITSYYWNENEKSFHYLMNQKWSSLILDNKGKWLPVSSNPQTKVNYYFGEWCPTWQKFVPFLHNDHSHGFHLAQWIRETRQYHLTISDILKLKEGDTIRVVHLDRNILDTCEYHNKPSVISDPQYFFRQSIGNYTHEQNLKGWFKFIEDSGRDFEFDVEYKKNHWYPLDNGQLPDSNEESMCSFGDKLGWKWNQFSLDTRIGWRGPMIEISKLKHCPNVYFTHNEPFLLI